MTDSQTGETIPGVSITLEGTVYGGATDVSGNYVIYNVPAGSYTLQASSVGYAKTKIENVKIIADYGAKVNLKLSPESIQTSEVVVVAERPLIEKTQTSSISIVTSEEISKLPTRGYNEVVSLQAGVVEDEDTGNLYIRGGRIGEVAYYVDGVSQNNPLTGEANTSLNNGAIEQVVVISGGFNAEYGRAMSGAVNTTTKSGGKSFNGSLEVVTDKVSPDESYGYNIYGGTIGGPLFTDKINFFLSGEFRDLEDRFPRSTASGKLPHNGLSGFTGQGKLNFNIISGLDLEFGGVWSQDKVDEYIHTYKFDIDHAAKRDDTNRSLYGKIKQTIGSKSFYEVRYNNFYNQRFRGDGTHFKDLESYGRSSNPSHDRYYTVFWNENLDTTYTLSNLADTTGFRSGWNSLNGAGGTRTIDNGFAFYDKTGNLVTEDQAAKMDTIYYKKDEGHVFNRYLHSESSYHGVSFDYTTQVVDNHNIKFGFAGERHTLRRYEHIAPATSMHLYNVAQIRGLKTDANPDGLTQEDYDALVKGAFTDVNAYGYQILDPEKELSSGAKDDASTAFFNESENGAKHPVTVSAYLQDTFEWEKFVLDIGFRFDYLDAATKALKDPRVPLGSKLDTTSNVSSDKLDPSDLTDSKVYKKISPRIGIAFPATETTHFYFSYGKFYQQPHLQDLYVSYDFLEYKVRTGGYYFALGNPNLKPEETIAYETGVTKTFNDNMLFGIKAYYKDINDLVQVQNLTSPDLTVSDFGYATYINSDYGTVKGVDFEYEMKRTNHVAIGAKYGLMWTKGTGSNPESQRNVAWTGGEVVKTVAPLDFDQRHNISLNIDISNKAKEGMMIGDFYPFENASANFQFNAGSGFPYTPVVPYNEVTLLSVSENPVRSLNSENGPWTYSLDMKLNKTFNLISKMNLEIYCLVKNLFDTENQVDIYKSSGASNTTNYLNTPAGQNELNANGAGFESVYQNAESNPLNYGQPRQVRFGLILNF
ncbi:TonB-dependent receptor [bacterium]|nr:TonB-dependent receptor [bacterium]